MYILENINGMYSYIGETHWNKELKKYEYKWKCVGKNSESGDFTPNNYLSRLFIQNSENPLALTDYEKEIIKIVVAKYGKLIKSNLKHGKDRMISESVIKTAKTVFIGPELVLGKITKYYELDTLLEKCFDMNIAKNLLSLVWYIVSEGKALSDSDAWLAIYQTPRGSGMSSQDISRFLDEINYDDILAFYSLWHQKQSNMHKAGDKMLYDLTSISYYGSNIDSTEYGYNRDHDNLPQVNYGLVCMRSTAIPIFAFSLNGSISDTTTLETTMEMLANLNIRPTCVILDRAFSTIYNITYMLRNKRTFLQSVKINAKWIYNVIDKNEYKRFNPDTMIKTSERTYYVSSNNCLWIRVSRRLKNGNSKEELIVHTLNDLTQEYINTDENITILEMYPCKIHILYCLGLVRNKLDDFMSNLKNEKERLLSDKYATVDEELEKYFIITTDENTGILNIDYNIEKIKEYEKSYSGYICFITNDATIDSAATALKEYSTRDAIEKDFDDMKNSLDMKRLRVHTDKRMKARLFIQFLAEIYMREMRIRLAQSVECQKLSHNQIFASIRTMYKIKFKGDCNDVFPELTKTQRAIVNAVDSYTS